MSLPIILAALLFSARSDAAIVNFSGFLDVIDVNTGGIYTAVPQGTAFSGFIDDVTFNGEITAILPPPGPSGNITTPFTCCIDAGGLGISNNEVLDADDAGLLNDLTGTTDYSAGQFYDIIDLEGDATTTFPGRIEIGISWLLDAATFDNEDASNYDTFDPNDAILGVFFIVEETSRFIEDDEIYEAAGLLQPIPVPAALWLFGSGLLGLIGMARRRRS